MIGIKAALLLTLATGTLAAGYSPYYAYRVSYGQGSPFGAYPLRAAPAVVSAPVTGIQGYPAAPATLAAYHGAPTRVYHATSAAVGAVPPYSAYPTAFGPFYQRAHAVVPSVFAPTGHGRAAAAVTKFAPAYSSYPPTSFSSVPKVNNVHNYQVAPGVVPARYIYQSGPVLSHPYQYHPYNTALFPF